MYPLGLVYSEMVLFWYTALKIKDEISVLTVIIYISTVIL